MLKLLTLLLVALVAAKAYDFSDFDYNQFLFNEFQLLNEEVVDNTLRQKRDAEVVPNEKKECSGRHGEWKNGFTCCSGDTFDPEHVKQMKEVKKECALKLRANNSDVENFDPFDCEKMNRIKQLIICESECFARAINILDKSGKLNREAILQRANEDFVYDNGWKQAVYEGYVDKCIAQIEAKKSQTQQQQCSSAIVEFRHCIWGEFINGCPADMRVSSLKCNKLRKRLGQSNAKSLNTYLFKSFLHVNHELKGQQTDVENFDPFDCEKMNRIKQLIICETECFARAVNVLDESGKLDREAILKRYSEHFVKDSDWKKAAYVDYVDKCLAQVEAKEPQSEQQCSSAPMEFHHCVWGEFINGCPAELRVDNHKCNKLRDRHSQNNGYFLNKHLLHGFLHGGHKHKAHQSQEQAEN